MEIKWDLLAFDELTTQQLYDILQLRAEVFVVEQDCVYQDVDGYDQVAHHLMSYQNGVLVAYVRIIPVGVKYADAASIGRVITHSSVRKSGYGKELMHQAIKSLQTLYGKVDIKISAQCYLDKFYKSFGFVTQGESYLEDDIPHQLMVLKAR